MSDQRERAEAAEPAPRRPRLLWANRFCLLDTSSGASMSVREMLRQLAGRGVEVRVLGATIFDSAAGRAALGPKLDSIAESPAQIVAVPDGPLTHRLVRTSHWRGLDMRLDEIGTWMEAYHAELEEFRPDLVMFYGGRPTDWLIPGEAQAAGIPSAAYVANGSYNRTRWCRDVDLILTDTEATADLYRARLGRTLQPVGKFVDPARVLARDHARSHVTFVTAQLAKGAGIVAQLALALEARRPDIRFEVIEGRGSWAGVVEAVSTAAGTPRSHLANVDVSPAVQDMRPVYARSRLLLAPSLWWESGGRVAVEAQINGVPVIATNRGGIPEMVGRGGYLIDLPEAYHEPPYKRLLTPAALDNMAGLIERLYDDDAAYRALSANAARHARQTHGLARSTDRLCAALRPYLGEVAAAS